MIAPAMTYGAAVPAMSNAAGVDPSTSYDALTPSFVESATLGFMTTKHAQGLRSGGLVGYSTFFTGYDPKRDGMGRAISLGRGAAQATSMTARALMHTGLQNTAAARYIEPFTQAHRYGIGGAASAVRATKAEEAMDVMGVGQSERGRASVLGQGRQAGASNPARKSLFSPVTSSSARGVRASDPRNHFEYGGSTGNRTLQKPDAPAGSGVRRRQIRASLAQGRLSNYGSTADDAAEVTEEAVQSFRRNKTLGGFFRFLTGMLGGKGYDSWGNFDGDVVRETIGDNEYLMRKPSSGSGGANIMKGVGGRTLGKAFRFLGGLEIANMAVDAATYAAGEGYESLVQTTERMQRRVGGDRSMSSGYYNRAAMTERQRAVQTLNSNRLNPRTQIQGNEAYYQHR